MTIYTSGDYNLYSSYILAPPNWDGTLDCLILDHESTKIYFQITISPHEIFWYYHKYFALYIQILMLGLEQT